MSNREGLFIFSVLFVLMIIYYAVGSYFELGGLFTLLWIPIGLGVAEILMWAAARRRHKLASGSGAETGNEQS
jgi:hypothetical protein